MPGLAMDPSQSSITCHQRSPPSNYNEDACEKQHTIKSEDEPCEDNGQDEVVYKPRPQLPKPVVFMRSLADLMKDLDNDLIDVDPEYQREVVWTADRMTGLIDSLMENFYIPPIILNCKTRADGSNLAVHVCVDGKQRLSSVRAFIEGMIPCHDSGGEKWWFCDITTSRRKKVLPEETQRVFLRKEFVSYEFKDLLPDQEEDLFARVQMGVQLSLAEKMRASTGPWQEIARLFVDDFPVIYSLMKDRARAKDFQLTLSCFSQIVEVLYPSASDGIPILKTNYNALPKLLGNKFAVDDRLKSHLASVWNTFEDLIEMDPDTFTNANNYLSGVQTFAPIEMVAVTVLISTYSGTRNKKLLLDDIRALREAIREKFNDIRANKREWIFIWKFLEDLEAIRGPVDGTTVDRRARQSFDVPTRATAPETQTSATSREASAEDRVRPTAGKKPSITLPPQRSFTAKKEEVVPSTTIISREPKRQRTHSGSSSISTFLYEQSKSTTPGTYASRSQPHPLAAQLAQYSYGQPQNPMPTHASVSHVEKEMPQESSSAKASPQMTTASHAWPTLLHAGTMCHESSTAQLSPTFTYTALPEPLQGYHRAPTAPIVSTAPAAAVQQTPITHVATRWPPVVTFSGTPLSRGGQPYSPDKSTTTLRVGRGAYSPQHTEMQWAGEMRSATLSPDSASLSSSTGRLTGQNPRNASPQSTMAQYDDAIGLTSDTEHERHDVLS